MDTGGILTREVQNYKTAPFELQLLKVSVYIPVSVPEQLDKANVPMSKQPNIPTKKESNCKKPTEREVQTLEHSTA